MYAVSDNSGKNNMGFTVVKKNHLLILVAPIQAILKYECMEQRREVKNQKLRAVAHSLITSKYCQDIAYNWMKNCKKTRR